VAENENRISWNTNPTIEKPRPRSNPERVSGMATTVKQSVMKLKPPRAQQIASLMSILVALCWGLLAGLLVCVPAGYYYRFSRQSAQFRNLDYTRRNVSGINADWDSYQRLRQNNAFLGQFSPVNRITQPLRANLMHAAEEVMEGYRNNSDPDISHFDWPKAVVCLQHALEMNRTDRSAQGELALANGYINLERSKSEPAEKSQAAVEAAKSNFEEAVTMIPRAPDPHLGLARIYVYSIHNTGKAIAELHEAQRLGFQLGPREMEQQADSYRFRAMTELTEARKAKQTSQKVAERYLRYAERDFDRARQLYEPIRGFSNVSIALRQVDDDDHAREELGDSLKKKTVAKHQRRPTNGRSRRWQ
jgi:hypothetical protein